MKLHSLLIAFGIFLSVFASALALPLMARETKAEAARLHDTSAKNAILNAAYQQTAVTTQSTAVSTATPQQGSIDPRQTELNLQKLEAEIQKLREEANGLRTTNESVGPNTKFWTPWLTSVGGILTGITTILIASFGYFLNENQRKKLNQDKDLGREKHLLEVFNELGSSTERVRMGAIAILVQRVAKLYRDSAKLEPTEIDDLPTIVSLLIASTNKESDTDIQKYTADGLAHALGAIVPEEHAQPMTTKSPFAPYDFQNAGLNRAWWKRVDARNIDFYGASFVQAGLTEAFLSHAIFKWADLSQATLNRAQLENANLEHAKLVKARLYQAMLKGAILRNANLHGADLRLANLDKANLTNADLTDADLRGASLNGTILTHVKLERARLDGVDLSKAIR